MSWETPSIRWLYIGILENKDTQSKHGIQYIMILHTPISSISHLFFIQLVAPIDKLKLSYAWIFSIINWREKKALLSSFSYFCLHIFITGLALTCKWLIKIKCWWQWAQIPWASGIMVGEPWQVQHSGCQITFFICATSTSLWVSIE